MNIIELNVAKDLHHNHLRLQYFPYLYLLQRSWKESLRTSLNNFRRYRPEVQENDQREAEKGNFHLTEWKRLAQTDPTVEISNEEYEEALMELQVLTCAARTLEYGIMKVCVN